MHVCVCVLCSDNSASRGPSHLAVVDVDTEPQTQTTAVSDAHNVYDTAALATIQETTAGQLVLAFQPES